MTNNLENGFDIREIKQYSEEKSQELDEIQKKHKKRSMFRLRNILLMLFLIVVAGGGYLLWQTNAAFDQMTGDSNSLIKTIAKMIPGGDNIFQILPTEKSGGSAVEDFKDDKLDRMNILVLGYRGVDDPNGGLLTDSIMILSIKKSTNAVALISVPRDLYVTLPHSEAKGKINEAYALGTKNGGWKTALDYSKQEIEEVTGLDIHYVASIDFAAFKDIVNTLGGITIYLDEPFVERVPFAEGSISLPAGKNNLTGEKALLYSRARESSSDFDRVRRQQQVLVAVKEKALSLGVVTDPTKMVAIINALGVHVRTSAQLWEMEELAGIMSKIDNSKIKRRVFDTSPAGLLTQSHASNGAYILLPVGGNYDKIHQTCKDIFDVTDSASSK